MFAKIYSVIYYRFYKLIRSGNKVPRRIKEGLLGLTDVTFVTIERGVFSLANVALHLSDAYGRDIAELSTILLPLLYCISASQASVAG